MLGLFLVMAAAQDHPDTVIRTTTRLVQIRVMATNRQGDPVTDLRKDELQLVDNRRPRPIQFLTFESAVARSAAAGTTSASTQSVDTRNDYAVFVLDWLNPREADRIKAWDAAIQLLETFQPRQQAALYVMAPPHTRLLHDFTTDHTELLQALRDSPPDPEDPNDPAKPSGSGNSLKIWAALPVEDRTATFNGKVLATIAALDKLADGLGRIPGRKSVIWVTNGFPIQLDQRAVPGAKGLITDYGPWAEPLIDHLNRANVALYTVDPRGLAPTSYGDDGTISELSERTGATSFYDRNDIAEGMREAFDDARTGYTMGFTLDPEAALGVHDIRLRSTRGGVKLRYRESYLWDGR